MTAINAFGFTTIRGLPAHILIVHFAVVLVPLSAVAVVMALRPTTAKRMGAWLPALCVAALLSVFAAMNAGGWLQNHVPYTALVRAHTSIAWELWPFSAAVALLSLAIWWLSGRQTADTEPSIAEPLTPIGLSVGSARTTAIIGVLTIAMALGSVVEVVRIGEAGSRAVWSGHYSKTAIGHH